jgi:hypothetical protein
MGLCHCLQCLQECPNRGTFPPLQTGLGLILVSNTSSRKSISCNSYIEKVSLEIVIPSHPYNNPLTEYHVRDGWDQL